MNQFGRLFISLHPSYYLCSTAFWRQNVRKYIISLFLRMSGKTDIWYSYRLKRFIHTNRTWLHSTNQKTIRSRVLLKLLSHRCPCPYWLSFWINKKWMHNQLKWLNLTNNNALMKKKIRQTKKRTIFQPKMKFHPFFRFK